MELVKAFKDFITEEERDILNEWTLSNYKNDYFIDPKMDSRGLEKTKLTTRFANPLVNYGNPLLDSSSFDHINFVVSFNPNFNYPDFVYELQKRIALTFDFEDFGLSPVGKEGIITEISFTGGTIYPHIDPSWFEGTYTVHCNFITQKPKSGGVTYIQGEPWKVNDTDLLMYIVSEAEHSVDEIVGDKERILWVFSFMLSEKDTKRIFQ
jgi:hypothetical protein